MRLHYYQFPDTLEAHTQFLNGAQALDGSCDHQERETCRGCPNHSPDEGLRGCPVYHCTEADGVLSGISITHAKELLKKFGGSAWTNHIDRDGGVFEVTDIKLAGNNSRFKYNKHL